MLAVNVEKSRVNIESRIRRFSSNFHLNYLGHAVRVMVFYTYSMQDIKCGFMIEMLVLS